ncbi:MAG: HemK/PrmC family methyltransferase [Desulfobaccales bacterium]|nr:HemK/PrmC family methyltransferase [Desulfobaccales bacterium]
MKAAAPGSWTILEILRWATDYFRTKGVAEPRASAEVLLAHALSLSRLDLYLKYDQPLTPPELARFKRLVIRRRQGEPVAYLTGHKEFWSLDFHITPGVLIPRPETEVLVSAALEVAKDLTESGVGGGGQGSQTPLQSSPKPPPPTPYRGLEGELEGRAGDHLQKKSPGPPLKSPFQPAAWGLEVGVGSGAVVVALAREIPWMAWVALDLSLTALTVARDNARRHEVAPRIRFLQADLLSSLKPEARFALLVANLPYVPRAEWEQLPIDIRDFEPKEALLAGEDGLALIRPLALEAHHYLRPGGWLALEVGPGQAHQVREFLQDRGAYDRLDFVQDYHGINRVVRARRRAGG